MNDSLEKDFASRHQRKTLGEVKAQLRAKNAFGAGACPVATGGPALQDVPQQIQILAHTLYD
jgi:hypothetical protein